MITVVQKPFEGPQGPLASGTLVDSSGWRNESRLLNTRFLRPASADELRQAAADRPAKTKAASGASARATGRRKVH